MSTQLQNDLHSAARTISRQQKQIDEMRKDLKRICHIGRKNTNSRAAEIASECWDKYSLGVEPS